METTEILLIGIGLAMDAFAVAVCKGLSMKKMNIKKGFLIAIWFGAFQAIMPTIGYFLGNIFKEFIGSIDHLIAFGLLTFIGVNMIKEAFKCTESSIDDSLEFKTMLVLALATSIDALTVGVTFSFFNINILFAALIIGIITLIMSYLGVKIGNRFGDKYEKKAQIIGGIILICLGIKNFSDFFKVF